MGKILYYFENYKKIKCLIPKNLLDDINNNGVILVTPHLGIYSTAKYFGYFTEKNIYCLHKNQKLLNSLSFPNNFYKKCKFIPVGDSFNDLLNLKGGSIILACDQKAHNFKEKYQFLNKSVYFHNGPASLKLKTERKIWYIDIIYNFDNRCQDFFFKDISSQLKKNPTKQEITQKIADVFSERIISFPEQYFWMHDRFNLGKSIH